jgi:hypothetical protein
MTDPAGTFEEWRITGDPGEGYPGYHFVWSRRLQPHKDADPEQSAREFVRRVRQAWEMPWASGPHLSRRTVVIGEWEDVP